MDADFNLKEWHDFKSQIVQRSTNTNMRRFSASNLKSFREDERCSRTAATTISSTVSSPGYTTREKIDPSTYSFTAALKGALQTRNACSWEHPQSEKLMLHSKWSDAEKYISNPLSGEVPLECLSAKTLGARSFRTLTNRITISAPLLYPSHHHHHRHFPAKSPIIQHHNKLDAAAQEKKMKSTTRDVGIQSVPPEDVGSGSRSPSTPGTPSIRERSVKYSEGESGDSSLSAEKEKVEEKEEVVDDERERKEKEGRKSKGGERKKMIFMMRMCSSSSSSQGEGRRRRRGCLSFKGLWQREKSNPKINNKPTSSSSSSTPSFLYHINACYDA